MWLSCPSHFLNKIDLHANEKLVLRKLLRGQQIRKAKVKHLKKTRYRKTLRGKISARLLHACCNFPKAENLKIPVLQRRIPAKDQRGIPILSFWPGDKNEAMPVLDHLKVIPLSQVWLCTLLAILFQISHLLP